MSDVDAGVDQPVGDDDFAEGWYADPTNADRERYWDGEAWGGVRKQPRERPAGKANRLAVTALICACFGPFFVGGILATVFGTVALDEIEDSEGAERGQGMARWAIWLGFLNMVLSGLAVIAIVYAIRH